MSVSKLIVVLGATGNQGGSVVDTFLLQPGWQVRAITRDSSSARSKSLAGRGVEVVEANLSAPETLLSAFEGAHAIFAVTNYLQILTDLASQDRPGPAEELQALASEYETRYLCNAIEAAAKTSTLERLVVSSLPHIAKWSGRKYTNVWHWDSKARAVEFAQRRHPELWAKTSILEGGWFLLNYVDYPFFRPVKQRDGSVHFNSTLKPSQKLPFVAPEEDTGPIVKALVEEEPGKHVIGYREFISQQELVDIFARVTGLESKLVTVSEYEFFAKMPPNLRVPLGESMAFFDEFGYTGGDPSVVSPKDSVADYLAKQPWAEVLASE